MTLGLQVARDGKRSTSRNTLLDEVFGGFEGVVIAKFGARAVQARAWDLELDLTLERGLWRGRDERDRLRTGAGEK
jgi:hypothetical protein